MSSSHPRTLATLSRASFPPRPPEGGEGWGEGVSVVVQDASELCARGSSWPLMAPASSAPLTPTLSPCRGARGLKAGPRRAYERG